MQSNSLKLFCYIIGAGGLLFGFDTAVISGTLSMVRTQFGLNSIQEGSYVSFGLYGCIAGVIISGFIADGIGRKKTALASALLYAGSAIGCAYSQNIEGLYSFRFAGGVGVGITSTVVPLYISELSKARNRGSMVAVYQLLLTAGILLAYVSNAVVLHFFKTSQPVTLFEREVWRPMYLAMGIPSVLYIIALLFVPESPRWLITKGKSTEAEKIIHQFQMEVSPVTARHQPLSLLFNRNNISKLIIGILIPFLGQFSGINAVIYYGPKIFEDMGFASSASIGVQVLIGLVNMLTTFIAVLNVDRWGRKTLLINGLIGIISSLFLLGVLTHTSFNSISVGLILLFISCYAFSLGPVQWVVISEMFPSHLRGRAVSICTFALWIGATLVGLFFPWLMEKTGIAAVFFFFAAISFLLLIILWKKLPENKQKSLEDIDEQWQNN
jgi:MFS transporter, SP family, arabinose:H+ symporter